MKTLKKMATITKIKHKKTIFLLHTYHYDNGGTLLRATPKKYWLISWPMYLILYFQNKYEFNDIIIIESYVDLLYQNNPLLQTTQFP